MIHRMDPDKMRNAMERDRYYRLARLLKEVHKPRRHQHSADTPPVCTACLRERVEFWNGVVSRMFADMSLRP